MDEAARNKVRTALREAVLSLCSNALDYTMELSVEGLIGVTVDKQDVFLVNVNEIVRSAEYEDLLAEPKSPQAPEEKVRPTFIIQLSSAVWEVLKYFGLLTPRVLRNKLTVTRHL